VGSRDPLTVRGYAAAMGERKEHQQLLEGAIATEGEAHRALLAGDVEAAAEGMRATADLYRESWEAAPPRSFGRLVGMLKAAVIAGAAGDAAAYARRELPEDSADSPASWYALGLAALIEGDDDVAARAADAMEEGSEAFGRAARAMRALANRDRDGYSDAVAAIVADFESRDAHLTGVAIADTALMFERLAEQREMAARPQSQVLPSI